MECVQVRLLWRPVRLLDDVANAAVAKRSHGERLGDFVQRAKLLSQPFQLGDFPIERCRLLSDSISHIGARRLAAVTKGENLPDVVQVKPDALRGLHKPKTLLILVGVDAIVCPCATRSWEDSKRLVVANGLDGKARAPRQITNEH